jgi:hypothetical protein
MKNKLFLALALAGAVACKKDNTPTPSPNTNDVSAQVTEFINKLDLTKDLATQVEAFAKTLKNDTEMENLLAGKARANNVWELEKFMGTTQMDTIEKRTFSWDKTNPYDKKGSEKLAYNVIVGNFFSYYLESEKAYNYVKQETSESKYEIYSGLYYTQKTKTNLSYSKECDMLTTVNDYLLLSFFEFSYPYDVSNNSLDKIKEIKQNAFNQYKNKEICLEHVGIEIIEFNWTDKKLQFKTNSYKDSYVLKTSDIFIHSHNKDYFQKWNSIFYVKP